MPTLAQIVAIRKSGGYPKKVFAEMMLFDREKD